MSELPERYVDDSGFDQWGYNAAGHYDSRFDFAPFQNSPYPHCEDCDNMTCPAYMSAVPSLTTTTGTQQ